jgi:hypothetical protein
MLIMGHPQFEAQNDAGIGHGIPPIPEWQPDSTTLHDDQAQLNALDIDNEVRNIFMRLRSVFQRAQRIPFSSTRLHDLTCFVIHRLLLSAPSAATQPSPLTECVRYSIILYMFIIQGPTYFSHAVIFNQTLNRFVRSLEQLQPAQGVDEALVVWFLAVGMAASVGTPHYRWLVEKARAATASLSMAGWDDALVRVKSVLWLETQQHECVFRPHWDAIFNTDSPPEPPDAAVYMSPGVTGASFI